MPSLRQSFHDEDCRFIMKREIFVKEGNDRGNGKMTGRRKYYAFIFSRSIVIYYSMVFVTQYAVN